MLIQNNPRALSLFLKEPVYLVKEKTQSAAPKAPVENSASAEEEVTPPKPIAYEGQNLKKVLLLYKGPTPQISDAQRTFLGKILQAVKLDFEDVALVNANLLTDDQFSLLNEFDPKVWLSFDFTHDDLPIKENQSFYKIFKTKNTSFLLAHSLDEIEADRDKKVLLWNNLKSLFSI